MTDHDAAAGAPDPDCPPVTAASMLVAAMSYNRGPNLRLAVESIERCLPDVALTVIDDGSDRPDTTDFLQELARRRRVLVSRAGDDAVYLRGLHANMNAALDVARSEGFEYVFFVQDDQQMVRPLDDGFFADLTRIFRADRAIAQICPMFFKGFFTRQALRDRFAVDEVNGFYHFRDPAGGSVGDIGVVSLRRLAACGFRFADTEHNSGLAAARLGLRTVFPRDPVLMYTPWPATPRDHPTVVEKLNLGVHPFEYMSEADIARLRARPVAEHPMAEDYLRASPALRRPWWYTVVHDATIRQYIEFCELKRAAGEL